MVPEGLVLLDERRVRGRGGHPGAAQGAGAGAPAVEGLARVDVVCLDKTGTLTEGEIVFDELEALGDGTGGDRAPAALGALAADENRNATLGALAAAFTAPDGWTRTARCRSRRRASGARRRSRVTARG